MTREIINAIVYTILDEKIGPQPLLWDPLDLPENIRMSVSIKSITMLSTDRGVVPKSLVIMPFPSINLKGIIKYIERKDDSYRGGVTLSSITLLFDEADDLIFYKYIDYLEPVFTESSQNIIELQNKNNKGSQNINNKFQNILQKNYKIFLSDNKIISNDYLNNDWIEGKILPVLKKKGCTNLNPSKILDIFKENLNKNNKELEFNDRI